MFPAVLVSFVSLIGFLVLQSSTHFLVCAAGGHTRNITRGISITWTSFSASITKSVCSVNWARTAATSAACRAHRKITGQYTLAVIRRCTLAVIRRCAWGGTRTAWRGNRAAARRSTKRRAGVAVGVAARTVATGRRSTGRGTRAATRS
jgi:hypothetical protein